MLISRYATLRYAYAEMLMLMLMLMQNFHAYALGQVPKRCAEQQIL